MTTARDVNRIIERSGGYILRQRGSHRIYEIAGDDGITCRTTVAQHGSDIPTRMLKAIDKDLAPALGPGWLTRRK
jgi:predicted RNA binding protein YcfA (HicA-like mRNA interferase family)